MPDTAFGETINPTLVGGGYAIHRQTAPQSTRRGRRETARLPISFEISIQLGCQVSQSVV